jgi:hypothetical protein
VAAAALNHQSVGDGVGYGYQHWSPAWAEAKAPGGGRRFGLGSGIEPGWRGSVSRQRAFIQSIGLFEAPDQTSV